MTKTRRVTHEHGQGFLSEDITFVQVSCEVQEHTCVIYFIWKLLTGEDRAQVQDPLGASA